MLIILTLPFIFWMEFLDILMTLIPNRVWDWLWRDVRNTGSNELAYMTDLIIRIVLTVTIIIVGYTIWESGH
jgi:hypothetical protein